MLDRIKTQVQRLQFREILKAFDMYNVVVVKI